MIWDCSSHINKIDYLINYKWILFIYFKTDFINLIYILNIIYNFSRKEFSNDKKILMSLNSNILKTMSFLCLPSQTWWEVEWTKNYENLALMLLEMCPEERISANSTNQKKIWWIFWFLISKWGWKTMNTAFWSLHRL
jgi:hypothetical protein